eukprot:4648329-Prorocentrum_lima.AAC.1
MVWAAWRLCPTHPPGVGIRKILGVPRLREVTLQYWASRLRAITNKQLYADRDQWLSSLSQ